MRSKLICYNLYTGRKHKKIYSVCKEQYLILLCVMVSYIVCLCAIGFFLDGQKMYYTPNNKSARNADRLF